LCVWIDERAHTESNNTTHTHTHTHTHKKEEQVCVFGLMREHTRKAKITHTQEGGAGLCVWIDERAHTESNNNKHKKEEQVCVFGLMREHTRKATIPHTHTHTRRRSKFVCLD